MSNKKIFIFAILLLIGLVLAQYFLIINSKPSTEELILERLTKIENQLEIFSSKKDSVRVVIQTIDKEIIRNEEHYKEITNNIITQPSSMDSLYITNFVDRFIENEGARYNLYPVREVEY